MHKLAPFIRLICFGFENKNFELTFVPTQNISFDN